MTEEKQEIKLEQIIDLLDKSYELYYVDYRDDLSEQLDKVQEAIHGDPSGLDDIFMDWDTWESEKYILEELKKEVASHFDIEQDEAEDLVEQYQDDIRNEIFNRDNSTPLKDLLRNTGSQIFFYDTGVEIGGYTDDFNERVKDCKRALGIKIRNKEFDTRIEEMCGNASYGGRLVVYFRDDLDDWINLDEKKNVINFSKDVVIAIIDNMNGSGGDTTIKHSFSLPFNRENLFLDKTIKYSYTYDVCGMCSDWCDGTEVSLSEKKTKKKVAKSSVNDHIEREKHLDEVYKNGGCTPGDMKYSRHRDVYYINNYPCGSKCPHCNTFWID